MHSNPLRSLFQECLRISASQQLLQSLAAEIEGTSNTVQILCELDSLFKAISLLDLGIDEVTEQIYQKDSFITDVPIFSSDQIGISLFFLSKGTGFPLHDHPEMIAMSYLLKGTIHCRNADIISVKRTHIEAREVRNEVINGPSLLTLTPEAGNLHSLTAREDCILLDVFLPNYSDSRDCTFFKESFRENCNLHLEEISAAEMNFREMRYCGASIHGDS